jgi:hypothetical protein
MEAFFQAFAIAVGGTALVGTCLLTRWLLVDRVRLGGFMPMIAVAAIVVLFVFGGRMSSAVTANIMALGFSPFASALTSIAVLCMVSGFVFAFFTAGGSRNAR